MESTLRTSSCTVTRATCKREAGLITSVEIASASVKYRCVGREQKSQTERLFLDAALLCA